MKIIKFQTIVSTNLLAKKLARKGARPWTVVISEEQSSGYGRKKSSWFSPRGGLYFSVILPKIEIRTLQALTMISAFVLAKVLKDNFSLEPFIKLPNDIFLRDKKVAGILIENVIGNEIKASVVGIGLNTNIDSFPSALNNKATSLKIEMGREVDNLEILEETIKEFKRQLKSGSP